MAKTSIGETQITLCDKEFTLRPSLAALVEFEDLTGQTAFEVLQDMREKNRMLAKVAAAAIYTGARAAGHKVTFDEIGNLLFRHGVSKANISVFEYLTFSLAGEQEMVDEENPTEPGQKTPAQNQP